MAELEQALYTRLTGYAGLSALVSTRIYPLVLPQKPTYPSVTYQRIDGVREEGMTGSHGLAHPRIQVDAWGATYLSVKAVAAQVEAALTRSAWTEDAVVVLDGMLDGERDLYEEAVSGAGGRVYRVSQDWILWHRE